MSIEISKFAPSITVFATHTAGFLIGPSVLEEDGAPVTVNGERYLKMLDEYLLPELKKRHMLHKVTFQQDGATPHITVPVKNFLVQNFQNLIISRGFELKWPPNSPDLSPLDFWLWGTIKSKAYKSGRPNNILELKQRIVSAFSDISADNCSSAVAAFLVRAEICQEVKGDHFEKFL